MAAIDAGDRPRAGADTMSGPDAERERLMLGVRRVAGVATGDSDAALRADKHMSRLFDAEVAILDHGRLMVLQPLLTDEVTRAVLALEL
jgi:hypothetical protein